MTNRNDLLLIPKDLALKRVLFTLAVMLVTSVKNVTVFFLQNGKDAISDGKIIVGLIFIILYYAKEPIIRFMSSSIGLQKNMIVRLLEAKTKERGMEIFLTVGENISYENPDTGYIEKMEASTIVETVKNYLENLWSQKFLILDAISTVLSSTIIIVGLVKVAIAEVEQLGFFMILLVFTCASEFYYSLGRKKHGKKQYKKDTRVRNQEKKMQQNLLNVIPLNDEHANFLQKNYLNAKRESVEVNRESREKTKFLDLFLSSSITIYMIILIVIVLLAKGIEAIDLELLLITISIAGIYQSFKNAIGDIVQVVTSQIMYKERMNAEKENFELIMAGYNSKFEKSQNHSQAICAIEVSPFSVEYGNDSRNKKYQLVSENSISFQTGDFVILTGPTGSGKSTFMNMIIFNNDMGENYIRVSGEKDAYPKGMKLRDKQMLGILPVLDELTLGDNLYDREKLIELLRAVNLYDEISEKTSDVLLYLANTDKSHFSRGQKQRLALVQMLYNMENDVDVVILDEVTNNLNHDLALKVMKYIKDFCKSKIVLFASHQSEVLVQLANKHIQISPTDTEKSYCITQVR